MKYLILILFFSLSVNALAQKNFTVTGVLADSVNQKNLIPYATISVYKAGDSVLTTYKLSDDKGTFKVPALEPGIAYRVVITAWLYKTYRKDFTIPANSLQYDLGTLLLSPKGNNVDEVVITAERPPIIVRKDTIEFNAESFKTLPTAVVEDLLKKLPGVVIDANGAILVNGKAVSKILVDGKEFFGGDQQIATKNLPANIIDKIQVADDPEAKRRDPDLIPANTPQVINLKLKKAIKQGAFGKMYAGGGLKEYFEAGGIINLFRDTAQVSILAYGNNINKPGFSLSDIQRIGGFSRSGTSSMMITSDGGFALDNISFGGLGNGIQKTGGAGANFNTLTKGGVKINAKYFYGQNNYITRQLINDNQAFGTGRFNTFSEMNSHSNNDSHNISGKIEWKIDTLSTLTFTPAITLTPSKYNSLALKNSSDGNNQLLNTSATDNLGRSDNAQYSLLTSYWKDFKKKGRVLNTSVSITKNDNLQNVINNSTSQFYTTGTGSSVSQMRDNNIRNFNTYLSSNYTEPLSKKLTLSLALSGNYLNNKNALATFFRNPVNQNYDIIVPNLSQTVMQSGIKTNTSARLRWAITKDLSFQPAVVYSTINLLNEFTSYSSFRQDYNFIFPSLIIRYKQLSFSYNPSFTEPDVQYIQPVANNTDPLYIQLGNPNLQPAKTHRLSINLYKYDPKTSINYSIYSNGSIKNDGVIMSRVINPNGVQVNTPINADGIWQFYIGGNLSKAFKNKKNQFTLSGGFWSNYNKNILEVNLNRSNGYNLSMTPNVGVRINLNDKFELNQSYSVSFQSTAYDDSFYTDRKFNTQNSDSELIIRYPKKFVFETNFRLQVNNQNIAGYNNNIKIWNAGMTYLFLKNDRAQLKFSVNDILQNSERRYVYITDNMVRDTQTNNIGRYFLLTLTYNIQNFGGKVGGKDRFFGF